MSTALATPLLVSLDSWPGIVLGISPAGQVVASNGRLDVLLDRDVVGQSITELLDSESSGRKWARIASLSPGDAGKRWDIIFRAPSRLLEPRGFSAAAGDGVTAAVWLIEHPVDKRVETLGAEIGAINSELATAQRALFKEQARLAAALKDLERSNAALDEFAHAASHDLKAPLRAIVDYVELLEHEAGPALSEETRGYVARIGVLGVKMRRMIDAVLEYARAGRMSSARVRVDTRAVFLELIEFLAPPPDVSIAVDDGLPVLEIERVPFEQVFRNLIANAIKYRRDEGARIRISASAEGSWWRFVVADNGPGIPATQQDRIWRLFHTSRPTDGTGIGLALVKRIVESQGGRVFVESAPGDGARFNVLWPAVKNS